MTQENQCTCQHMCKAKAQQQFDAFNESLTNGDNDIQYRQLSAQAMTAYATIKPTLPDCEVVTKFNIESRTNALKTKAFDDWTGQPKTEPSR